MTPLPSIENRSAEDAQLIAAVQAGDLHAYEPLVGRHLDAINAFVALKLPVPHLVDEITHETFVFAFAALQSLLATPASAGGSGRSRRTRSAPRSSAITERNAIVSLIPSAAPSKTPCRPRRPRIRGK